MKGTHLLGQKLVVILCISEDFSGSERFFIRNFGHSDARVEVAMIYIFIIIADLFWFFVFMMFFESVLTVGWFARHYIFAFFHLR